MVIRWRNVRRQGFLFSLVLLLPALCVGCRKPVHADPATPPLVTVARPTQEQVADFHDLTGTVVSSRTVDLVARVSGYLRSAEFQEGSFVTAGQLLFVIEPEPYEQQMRLAEAALLRAESEYRRQLELSKDNATSTAAVERWLSERDQASAQLELARLNLGYTRVTAPFSGRIGRRFVDPGNLVGPSANTRLATLEQIDPIYVDFNLNERDALRIRKFARERGLEFRAGQTNVPVWVGLQDEQGYPHQGILSFAESGIDPSSGTVLLRATLENGQRILFPGVFTRVRLPLSERQPALVVPGSAVGNDQEGDYVLVVDSDGLVTRRSVSKGPLTVGGCVIRSGLHPEDRVIINGLMKARPGAKVTPVNVGPAEPSSSRKASPETAFLNGGGPITANRS